MLAGDVLSLAADGTVRRRHVGDVAAAVRPRRGGGAVIAVERGFALEDADGTLTPLEPRVVRRRRADERGRLRPRRPLLVRVDGLRPGGRAAPRCTGSIPTGRCAACSSGVTISNGLEWSPDGSLAYYADTATHRVDVFDYDRDAGLTGRRPFVTLADDGDPDGLTVDAEGGVWVALNGSGAGAPLLPDRRPGRRWCEVPTAQVTACTFGGPRLDQLFITTSREGMAPDDDPIAGSLFRADVGVAGRPVREFAG